MTWYCNENMFGWVITCETPDIKLSKQIHRSDYYGRLATKRRSYFVAQIRELQESVL